MWLRRLSSGEFCRFLVRSGMTVLVRRGETSWVGVWRGMAVEARIGLFWSGALRFVRSRYVSAVGVRHGEYRCDLAWRSWFRHGLLSSG